MLAPKSCILGILAKETRLQVLHLYPHMTLTWYTFKLLSSFCHLLQMTVREVNKSQALKICSIFTEEPRHTWYFPRYPKRKDKSSTDAWNNQGETNICNSFSATYWLLSFIHLCFSAIYQRSYGSSVCQTWYPDKAHISFTHSTIFSISSLHNKPHNFHCEDLAEQSPKH